MKRTVAALAALVATVMLTAGSCEQQQLRDLEDVPVQELEGVRIYVNVDGYANMVVGCIEGAAFVFTTRDYEAFERIPDLDADICGAAG